VSISTQRLLALRKFSLVLARVPYVRRLSRLLRSRFLDRREDIVVDDFDGTLSLQCGLDEHIESHIFWEGYYSRDLLRLLRRLLKTDSVFVDIGANMGEFTLFAAKRVPRGKVYAFEPVAEAFARLEGNVRRNKFTNVFLRAEGLMDQEASLPIYAQSGRFADGSRNTGLYTLHPHDDRNLAMQEIQLVRLDDLVSAGEVSTPTIMKIDVEGAELAVLKGARRVLAQFHPVLILELARHTLEAAGTTQREVVSYLEALGYRMEIIRYMGATSRLDPERIPEFCNVVCFPVVAKR